MEIDLRTLKVNTRINYDEDIVIDKNIYYHKDIKEISNLHLKGDIYYNSMEVLEFNLELTGNMIIKDSVTLEDIDYPFDIKIEEEYELNDEYFKEYYEKEQNILDIMTILWENIVLEVPISITNHKDIELSGEGWSLGENKKVDEIDPRLAKLAEVLENRKE